ncbi:MAG: hypothetical protein JNM57_04160 [Cyclobacteriaceae bacterium]|nr:hypothetical protein [Cyclobacteriaceae bacterium]
MKNRINFYLFILAIVVLDAVLLRSPNLLGKIGLILYKYDYLRTFPKALLTVSLVAGAGVVLAEAVRYMVQRAKLKFFTGRLVLFVLFMASTAMLVKTVIDFTAWSYSHTGLRFQLGAFLLPLILMIQFFYSWRTMPKATLFPVSPVMDTKNKTESYGND